MLCIIGHLNINSIRNKFVLVENVIKAFDIFLISESKIAYFCFMLQNLNIEIEIDFEVV